jgi:spore germination protein YaaH
VRGTEDGYTTLHRLNHFVLALIALVMLPTSSPGSALAANSTPVHDETHPLVMQQAAAEVANAPLPPLQPFAPAPRLSAASHSAAAGPAGPRREIFGFGLASSLTDPTIGYPSWNFSLLTTVAFFGLHVTDAGIFASDSGSNVWNSSQLSGLISTAHAAGTKVVLTIILQDFTSGTPHMCSGLANRATTVSLTVGQVGQKGVDGVNVDYEGLNLTCPNGQTARSMMTDFERQLRAALPSSYLSVDTYASSAGDPSGFFDIPALSPNTDSFFVMAYDAEYSNYYHYPTQCPNFCLGPTAPLTGYYYNDTVDMSAYTAVVAPSKVILGVPYYGRKACVSSPTPNQYPVGTVTADGYLDATAEAAQSTVQAGSYVAHRDAHDPAGQERWDTWQSTSLNCARELYWDDVTSLGFKYDLVNQDNLRGVGIWNLNFGGGAPELWNQLAAKFSTTTPWTSIGGGLTSAPEATSWGSSRADIFMRGNDGALWHTSWNGTTWASWEPLGGLLVGDPGAVSWGPMRIDVFIRGADNALWHRALDQSGTWSGWQPLGGTLNSGADVASWGSGRLDIFVLGSDNGLWHMAWDAGAWTAWQPLGGLLTSDVTAVSWGPNRIDIFARGGDNALWHRAWDGLRWTAWQNLGGSLTSAPAASSCSPGHLDVFANGRDGSLWHLGWNGASWTGWGTLGGRWTSGPGAVCRATSTSVDVFARGSDGALWQTAVPGS